MSSKPSDGSAIPFVYDPAGNLTRILSSAFSYNDLNQIESFAYDANGNLLRDALCDYAWDAENRLISVKGRGTATVLATYRYDGLGRRVVIAGRATGQQRFVWCGTELCQKRSGANAVTARYLAEGETHAGAPPSYYALDQVGSIRAAVTRGSGAATGRAGYDPYGQLIASSGIGQTDYGFAGLIRDSMLPLRAA